MISNNSSKMVDKDLYALKPLLRRALTVYHSANTLIKILPTELTIKREALKDLLRDKFLLSKQDADTLTDQLFYEANTKTKLTNVAKRIAEFCLFEQGMKREMEPMSSILKQLKQLKCTEDQLETFVKKLRDSIASGHILPSEIRTAAYECELHFNVEKL